MRKDSVTLKAVQTPCHNGCGKMHKLWRMLERANPRPRFGNPSATLAMQESARRNG